MEMDKINELLNKEIEFAKGCGMPQFVMGLQQAKKILNDYKPQKLIDCDCKGAQGNNK